VAVLLVSDLHLSARRPETAALFLSFLAGEARAAEALYILGDLFDAWLGDDDLAEPFNRQIAAALADCTAAGTAIRFLPGNRDFLVGESFATACGLTLLPEASVHRIGAETTLLLHGDTLCTDDADYQSFRATVRAPAWQAAFLARPLAERRRLGEELREGSESAKAGKAEALMDVNPEAVAAAFRAHGVNRLIHGHTHRRATHRLTVDGRPCERWVLGEWGLQGNALACDDTGWHWLDIR
jgi:UDP-2,3-diacylglucosamine hydrolase